MMINRRDFLKGAVGTAVVAMTARSYGNIIGANDRVNVAVIGTRSRGKSLLGDLIKSKFANVTHICDVDSRVLDTTFAYVSSLNAPLPTGHSDMRRLLDASDLDAVVIATPDHWHATASVMSLKAGMHVYVEKPSGHNPQEGQILEQAQQKYQRFVQMGNQQRSSPETIELMGLIARGEIGEPYHADCWYANNRQTIGNGVNQVVPDYLDWDLWQGPAPRRQYADNIVPYNWHWFWLWGTGELCNNAAHELDIARWALGVDFAKQVTVDGSRRFFSDDDWEMYDTLFARYEFEHGKSIAWEGHSCNKVLKWNRSRGAMIYGTRGSVLVDRSGYTLFNLDGDVVRENVNSAERGDSSNLVGGGLLTSLHIDNFLKTINGMSSELNSPIQEGLKSTLLCHLGNIAYRTDSVLNCDPNNGHILKNDLAQNLWGREYEAGWNLKI